MGLYVGVFTIDCKSILTAGPAAPTLPAAPGKPVKP